MTRAVTVPRAFADRDMVPRVRWGPHPYPGRTFLATYLLTLCDRPYVRRHLSDSGRVATELTALLPRMLGERYLVERELGGGGMSRLFLATEVPLNRRVVVKVLPPELTCNASAARFQREIDLTAQLQHPHILPVLTAGACDDILYYITPYVEGETLRQRLERVRRLPIDEAIKTLREVADAISFAHQRDVVHRDIKPENVFLTHGHVVVGDFGIARALHEASGAARVTRTGYGIGTPGYMPPEQAAGRSNIDARADVYALAVLGYEMLTGEIPLPGLSEAPRHDRKPLVFAKLPASVPNHIRWAIAKGLSTEPDGRPASATEFRNALDAPPETGHGLFVRHPIVATLAVAAIALGLGRTAVLAWHGVNGRRDGNPNLVVVVPFDVLGPDTLYRQGLVDQLSRNFDGAGPLRPVPPPVAVKNWADRANRTSAAALARSTGAGLAVFGRLASAGPDSIRLAATMLDVSRDEVVGEAEIHDVAVRIDRAADSLTVHLLRALNTRRPIAAVMSSSIGSHSMLSLKYFLQGEQYYRANKGFAAETAYANATKIDSTFALALHRMRSALRGNRGEFDSLSFDYALRAGALNHGLGPRDSLLILADSLYAAHQLNRLSPARWSLLNRQLAVLKEVTEQYPNDPDAWMELGEAQAHFGEDLGVNEVETLRSFERAVLADPGFAPPYFHLVVLETKHAPLQSAARIIASYLRVEPNDSAFQFAGRLLSGGLAREADCVRALRELSTNDVGRAAWLLRSLADSTEVANKLYDELERRRGLSGSTAAESSYVTRQRARIAAQRGRLRAAYGIAGEGLAEWDPAQYAFFARLGRVPHDSARRTFSRWLLSNDVSRAKYALSWWAAERDTGSISALISMVRRSYRAPPNAVAHVHALYAEPAAQAYLALARADSNTAERLFAALPDTLCGGACITDQVTRADLLARRGKWREAAAVLDRHPPSLGFQSVFEVLWVAQRGRVAAALGDTATASSNRRYAMAMWWAADSELTKSLR